MNLDAPGRGEERELISTGETTFTEVAWTRVQEECDRCPTCLGDSAFDRGQGTPARPWWPERQERLVLISEAPPLSGGFWQIGSHDGLREHLFCILQGLGYRFPYDLHADEALRAFMATELFLLQTLKWPIGKDQRSRRRSFNNLSPREQGRLIQHTVSTHIGHELTLLAPRAVLAMGNAAWSACVEFVPGNQNLRKVRVSVARGQRYVMEIGTRPVPLETTSLPVGQNMRQPAVAAVVREDVATFLNHNLRA